jgi:hypothetical protein
MGLFSRFKSKASGSSDFQRAGLRIACCLVAALAVAALAGAWGGCGGSCRQAVWL